MGIKRSVSIRQIALDTLNLEFPLILYYKGRKTKQLFFPLYLPLYNSCPQSNLKMTSKLDENLFGTYLDLIEWESLCSTSKLQNDAKMTHPNIYPMATISTSFMR